ncbi:MAG: Fic family protein [Niabella sp.]|nr:Fic family protein [Niabella sp.]
MKPPYEITPRILVLIASISEKVGAVNAQYLVPANPTLRKQNQIKTIHASLHIEGNSLSEDQVTALLENKRVIGPQKDVTEVMNALSVYEQLHTLSYSSEKDFLKAHRLLMKGLIPNSGNYRTKGVGIVKGSQVTHVAPPGERVPGLMKELFKYLKDPSELVFIKSCVFHYEMEFIHPFADGNGRMGRLWQTLILMNSFPVFQFLPFETLIAKNQEAYYRSLAVSDKEGKSTRFIEYLLQIIDKALDDLLKTASKRLTGGQRMQLFLEQLTGTFSRKDYMQHFKELSSASASRDLKAAVEQGLLQKWGDKKLTRYKKMP